MNLLFAGPMNLGRSVVSGLCIGPANDKAHIQLTKCFALSDFWWGSLSPARSGPSARGARRVYMIKKIQPVVEKKIQPEVASFKRQAPSFKQQATLDNGYGIV